MIKNLVLYIVLGIFLLLILNIFLLIKNPSVYTDLVPGGRVTVSDGKDDVNGFIVFPSTTGVSDPVSTRDFRKDSDVVKLDEVTFQFDEGVANNEISYQIFFDDIDKSFTLSLLQEPLASSRLNAEEALLKRLAVPKNDLCSMKIIVNTPSFVSEDYSGNNLGLSFCPGAMNL